MGSRTVTLEIWIDRIQVDFPYSPVLFDGNADEANYSAATYQNIDLLSRIFLTDQLEVFGLPLVSVSIFDLENGFSEQFPPRCVNALEGPLANVLNRITVAARKTSYLVTLRLMCRHVPCVPRLQKWVSKSANSSGPEGSNNRSHSCEASNVTDGLSASRRSMRGDNSFNGGAR
jgi:hypothetical protein